MEVSSNRAVTLELCVKQKGRYMIGGASSALAVDASEPLVVEDGATTKFGGTAVSGRLGSTDLDACQVERTTPSPNPTRIPIKKERKDCQSVLFWPAPLLRSGLPSGVDPYFGPTSGFVSLLLIVQSLSTVQVVVPSMSVPESTRSHTPTLRLHTPTLRQMLPSWAVGRLCRT